MCQDVFCYNRAPFRRVAVVLHVHCRFKSKRELVLLLWVVRLKIRKTFRYGVPGNANATRFRVAVQGVVFGLYNARLLNLRNRAVCVMEAKQVVVQLPAAVHKLRARRNNDVY